MLGLLIDLFFGTQSNLVYQHDISELNFNYNSITKNKELYQFIYCFKKNNEWKCVDQHEKQIFNYQIQCPEGPSGKIYQDQCIITPEINVFRTVVDSQNYNNQDYHYQDDRQRYQDDNNNYRKQFKQQVYSNVDQEYYQFSNNDQQPVLLKNIQTLLFKKNEKTKSNKGIIFDQLRAQGMTKLYLDEVICQNSGWDGSNVIWKCTSNLPNGFKLANTKVSCEGWNGPGDTSIVPGSCFLSYIVNKR